MENCGKMGESEKMLKHPSDPSNDLDWRSSVPDSNSIREIPLTQGKVAVVDAEDYERLVSMGKWIAHKTKKHRTWYARRNPVIGGVAQCQHMHRVILGLTDPAVLVDHRDGDGLNNRKSNLRISTNAQNQWNSRIAITNTSGVKGVHFDKATRRWYAAIRINGKRMFLGTFTNKEAAGLAYANAAREHRGEFAEVHK